MIAGEQLIARLIEADPQLPGAEDARIAGTGVPVWALIAYLQAAHGDVQRVADDYELPLEAIIATRAYYRQHRALIQDFVSKVGTT